MPGSCQDPTRTTRSATAVLAVAGAAGSGKTTLGRALARTLATPLLDLDSLTNPLLDRIDGLLGDTHWNAPGAHAAAVRAGRYAVLRSAAADMVTVGLYPVLVAPFTSELAGGTAWRNLLDSVAPATLTVIYIDGAPELLARRRERRGAARDEHRRTDLEPAPAPRVPHLRLDATLTTDQQVDEVMRGIGVGTS